MQPWKRRTSKRPIIDHSTQKLVLSEFKESQLFWEYCQKVLRLGMDIYHIPNEGQRTQWYGKALISIGLTPGACDYHYVVANEKYHGLWLEIKTVDERDKTKRPEQDAFIANLLKRGHYATYAYGCDDAIKIYTDYVNNKL